MTFLSPTVFLRLARRVQFKLDSKDIANDVCVYVPSGGRGCSFINDWVEIRLEPNGSHYRKHRGVESSLICFFISVPSFCGHYYLQAFLMHGVCVTVEVALPISLHFCSAILGSTAELE